MARRSSYDAVIDDCLREMEGELEGEDLPAKGLQLAVNSNRRYKIMLGWQNYEWDINRLLGFTNSSPSESLFAQSVANWQQQQGLFPIDGMIGPMTWARMQPWLGIAPASSPAPRGPAPTRAPAGVPAWVPQLAPLLTKYAPDIPLAFLLGWISVESGGRLDDVTSLDERGYFQLHPGESQALHADHQRLSTDSEYSIQKGIELVRLRAAQAKKLGFPEGTELFWRATKWRHWVPGAVDLIVADMRANAVNPVSWDVIKQYVSTNRNRLIALFQARLKGSWDPMTGIANVDKVFQRGNQLAASLGGP